MMEILAFSALVLAAIPFGLFVLNLYFYRSLPGIGPNNARLPAISVLIPARNEAQNIRATLHAVLGNRGCRFEVVVLDDHSTDLTSEIVVEIARSDDRIRLETAPPLPPDWCGKQHACHHLSKLARHPLLLFIDADVRLAPDALTRIVEFMESTGVALASGVPRQELGTLSERLLIPLIHFVLLGFLPMLAMRRTRLPGFSAGCGQLFVARREAYEHCGGHAKLRGSLHDGLKLPRAFREAGFQTDLFDATDLATCRMYHTNSETWRGLGKNASEGLAEPGLIGPMTVFLLVGQVLPFLLLAFESRLSVFAVRSAALSVALIYFPRIAAARRFRQPMSGALLHPLGVLALVAIQWHAFRRRLAGKPSEWKGRNYTATSFKLS